ncbi:MAG: hypothetical protein J6A98_03220 [Clostridia bacterium]|nr:hypothetical protein [Clostridia bacterium]
MELKVWVKTFFSIYRWLEKLAKAVDGYVTIRGVSCFYKNLRNITLCGTEKVVQDITGLMNKKISLINIKHLCDKLLCALPENLARFVIAKYVDDHTFEEVAKILDVNIRTTLRWNVAVLEKCTVKLQNWGWTHEKILHLIDHEKWILDLAKDIEIQQEINHSKKLAFFAIYHEAEKSYKKFMI